MGIDPDVVLLFLHSAPPFSRPRDGKRGKKNTYGITAGTTIRAMPWGTYAEISYFECGEQDYNGARLVDDGSLTSWRLTGR